MLVEVIEVPDHPWFVGCQFHPEFTSTPREGHPLFTGFISAAVVYNKTQYSDSEEGNKLDDEQSSIDNAEIA